MKNHKFWNQKSFFAAVAQEPEPEGVGFFQVEGLVEGEGQWYVLSRAGKPGLIPLLHIDPFQL